MSFRKLTKRIHLWLGLSSGIIVMFLGVTGCILAFQKEIESLQTFRYVEKENKSFLPPSFFKAKASEILPGKNLHSVEYASSRDAAKLVYFHYEPTYYYIAYLNPYSGELLKMKNMDVDFFRVIINGHFYLWLPPNIGQPIIATATLIFVIMVITGIILWFPKNKAALKQRFKISTHQSFKRKIFDFHSVLGFYTSLFALIIAFTGLVWGFHWFANSFYWITSGGKTKVDYYEVYSDKSKSKPTLFSSEDKIWDKMKTEYSTAETIEVHYPETDSSTIAVGINGDADTYWKMDYHYFDQYSLLEKEVKHQFGKYTNASSVADKIARMNYDIHTGAILGIPGKIIAFLVSLIIATLPITGFLLWRKRNKKKHL